MRVAHMVSDLRLPIQEYEQAGPAVLRMLVGAHLRRLREDQGISREDAGYRIRASGSKISRMELGRVALKDRDVADLLALYRVSDEADTSTVLDLAKRASVPGWWRAYGESVPAWFEPYLGLEQGASMIRSYEIQCIPGLLQTESYARAVIQLGHRAAPETETEARVRLRMRRQAILTRPEPATLWAIIDEGALRRPVGGPATMRAQIQYLIDSVDRRNITIQLLPFSATAHASTAGPIAILRFPEWNLPDVVYLEQLTGAVYPDRPGDIERHWDAMNRLVTEADPPAATVEALHRIMAEI
jgi:transcriptional regulator with XRE-family HTH domain